MVRISTLATNSSGLVARIIVLMTDVKGPANGDIIFFFYGGLITKIVVLMAGDIAISVDDLVTGDIAMVAIHSNPIARATVLAIDFGSNG